MAKGILDKVDTSTDKGSELSYQGMEKYNPSPSPKPKIGTLKKILDASKESQQFSPYKKDAPKPTVIKPNKVPKSYAPVEQAPMITQEPLDAISNVPVDERVSKRPEEVRLDITPEVPISEVKDPLATTRSMAQDYDAKVRDRINQMAETIYSSPRAPLEAKDVWKAKVKTGLEDGSIYTVPDEQGNVEIVRKAPGLFEAVWEGQKSLAEGLREGTKYQFESDEQKKRRLEDNYIYQISSIPEEQSKTANRGRIAGSIGGQVLLQSGGIIPWVGPAIRAASIGALALSQDLQYEQEAYNMARSSGLEQNESLDVAKKGKGTYIATGVAESLISNLVGGKLLKSGASAATSKGFINASKQFLKSAKSAAPLVAIDATVAATMSVIRDVKLESVTGGDVDIKQRAIDNAVIEIAAGGALTSLGIAYSQGKQYIPKWFKSQSLDMASSLDENFVETSLNEMKAAGQIDEVAVKAILEDIKAWDKTKSENPGISDDKSPTVIGYIMQKKNLEESLKNADESSQPAIAKKIEEINAKIAEAKASTDPLATEQDDITMSPVSSETTITTEIKPQENATTISQGQQQEGATEGNISQRQGIEVQQEQATNEADSGNRPVSSQEEVIPKTFDTEQGRRVISQAQGIISRTNFRQGNKDIADVAAKKNVNEYIKRTKLYKDSDDVTREQMLRDAQQYLFDTKFKSSPSVSRLFSELKPNQITVNEMTALKRVLKFGESSASGAIKFSKNVKGDIMTGLKELGRRGVIKVTQLNSIATKLNELDVTSDKKIDKFVTYASKIISDANYNAKIKEAKGLRNIILNNASKKSGQVNLSNSANDFADINPSNVENIDEYISVAGSIVKGIKSPRVTAEMGVNFPEAFSDKSVNDYNAKQTKYIEDYKKAEKMADYQSLVDSGVISSDMAFDEMETIISAIEETGNAAPKDKEKYIRSFASKRIDSLSAIAKSLINNGTDGFGTDVDMEITPLQKRVVSKILEKDINNMSLDDIYRVEEALSNFVTNGKTSGLDAISKRVEGANSSVALYKTGIKARPLKLAFSKAFGRGWNKAFDSVPMKFNKMFGIVNAPKVARAMGLTELENGKNTAVKIHNNIEKSYVDKFKNRVANGEEYNTSRNIVERGLLGFVRRNSGGSDLEIQNEFNRRKGLIEESISVLSNSNSDVELRKAELYKSAYDKLLADANNIADVESKSDATNIEIVNWFTNEWGKHYDKLYDVTLNVYNQDLGRDNNYNTDVYRFIEQQDDDSSIFENSGFTGKYDYIPQKKSGTLIKSVKPTSLPEKRVIDLSFDMNQSNALKYALVDVYTAGSVRKVDAFLKAPTTKKIINQEDLSIVKSSISDYVKRSRGMEGIDNNELKAAQKILASASRFATSAALVGLGQPIKQTVPLIIKTMVSTNGKFSVKEALELMNYKNAPVGKFLDESGYGISIRGAESSTGVMSVDRLISQAEKGVFSKTAKAFDKWNENLLKAFVSNPDKWVARAAWITYYKSKLNQLGVSTSNLDWNTHEINQEAADFAQSMIDTQQNVSDRDLMGSFMGSKNANVSLARAILMPFSNFVMNAKSKTQADVINMFKGASKEEKAASARSFAGTILEMAVFNAVTGAIGIGLSGLASDGETSEKEENAKWSRAAKSAVSNFASDLLSPVPQTNALVGKGINMMIDSIDKDTPDELKFRLYGESERPIWQDWGLFGIGAKKIVDNYDAWQKAVSGEIESEYFGKTTTKTLPEEEKERVKIAAMIHTLVNLRILPLAEAASLANKIIKNAESKALTEKKQAYADVVSEIKIPDTGVVVDGQDISKAMSKALSYSDPEARAKYLVTIADKYGEDFIKSLDIAEQANILDKATTANFVAINSGVQDNIDVSRLFSYRGQDARAKKLSDLRKAAIAEGRLSEFYEGFKFGSKYGLLNESGYLLYIDLISKDLDADSEEAQMLLDSIED